VALKIAGERKRREGWHERREQLTPSEPSFVRRGEDRDSQWSLVR